ncbi:hypothetical protein [Floccifex sp.]|uniref:hypothetical protein n=1 Tax=Floccifex sp. TaxID=2815810 RepID=UPI002A750FB3|nr:hypothetical protein [Floccifex sp.]MDD7280716.1 hypothetical protein [Erysipelotrichaceae bacterium]MDY2959146.1 hypothetical protein [Floccifex sp.]
MAKVIRSGNSNRSMTCPECGSHNIELYEDNMEYVSKTKTTLNLNPLHPFRLTNHKTQTKAVPKKKVNSAKVGAALMTGGMSLLVTGGVKSKAKKQWYCCNCGCIFEQ